MNHPRYEDLLNLLKALVKNVNEDESYDLILFYALVKSINDVANYCNIPVEELPESLDYTIVAMAHQLIDTHGYLNTNGNNKNVASLSEGDASISFRSPADFYQSLSSINSISDNFITILDNFRRVKW